MKLEQQVTSLEISKKLKELGVKQESYFSWAKVAQKEKDELGRPIWEYKVIENHFQAEIEFISAFTVAELGEMLPKEALNSDVLGYFPTELMIEKGDGGWYVYYKNISELDFNGEVESDENIETKDYQTGMSLADAMGKMLIYLIENKLIKI